MSESTLVKLARMYADVGASVSSGELTEAEGNSVIGSVVRAMVDGVTDELAAVQREAAIAETLPCTTLPQDSAARKNYPIDAGCMAYFPAAIAGVAWVSKMGNDKHNPGQPLHWSRDKSSDHAECIQRHQIDRHENDGFEPIQYDVETGAPLNYWATVNGRPVGPPQVLYTAWRALAQAQLFLEQRGFAPKAPGAK